MNLKLLMVIDVKNDEKLYTNLLKKYKVKFKAITYGEGTTSSKILERFGLNEEDKIVIFAIMPDNMSKHILKDINEKLNINIPGGGIAFTIPISSSSKYMQDVYKDNYGEDIQMAEVNKQLIITIINEGYAETVMSSAKKAGATGGTVINGRGLETEKIVKFLGLAIEPEKDILLILTDNHKKTKIMDKIVETCGLKTPASGLCFSIPVDHAVGLEKIIEKD